MSHPRNQNLLIMVVYSSILVFQNADRVYPLNVLCLSDAVYEKNCNQAFHGINESHFHGLVLRASANIMENIMTVMDSENVCNVDFLVAIGDNDLIAAATILSSGLGIPTFVFDTSYSRRVVRIVF